MISLFGKKKARQRLVEVLKGTEPPAFSQAVLRLMRQLRDPESDMDEIASSLSCDPGLVVRTLKTVNSAAFGLRGQVECVQHAVTIMGRSRLEQLVLGLVVKDNLPGREAPGFDPTRFWESAYFRAALARSIASRLHPAEEARSFTGGLLQDMAVPLLAHARAKDYGPLLECWHADPQQALHRLEQSEFGFSHDEIGGHLAVEWELPESLASVILAHHDESAGDRELPPALRLVSVLRETETEHGIEALVETARSDYGLDADWLAEAVDQSTSQARELAA